MLSSLILSLLAGLVTRRADPLLAAAIGRLGARAWRPDPPDLRVLTFGLMLLLAASITAALGANSSAWLAAAGALLGYFGKDLYALARDPHGAMGDTDNDWDGALAASGGSRPVTQPAPPPGESRPADRPDATEPAQSADDAEETLRAVQAAVQPPPADIKEDER